MHLVMVLHLRTNINNVTRCKNGVLVHAIKAYRGSEDTAPLTHS